MSFNSFNVTLEEGLTIGKGLYLIWSNLLSLTGIIGHASVFWVILKHRKTTFNNSFYTMALSLALCDVTTLFLNFTYVTPMILVGLNRIPYWYVIAFGNLNGFAVVSSLLHMVAISLNRLVAVIMLQRYKTYFTTTKLALILGLCYGFSFFTCALVYGCGCIFVVTDYAWHHICSSTDPCKSLAMTVVQVETTAIFFVTFFVYVAIVVRLRKKDQSIDDENQNGEIRRERALVIQFGMVCLVYFVYFTVFWFIFSVQNAFTRAAGQWVLGSFALFHASLNPFLYMTFGSEVRRLLFSNAATSMVGLSLLRH